MNGSAQATPSQPHGDRWMPEPRKLRINWVLPRPTLAGGVKSNRLIAEAMVRRGHDVRIAYANVAPSWPPLRQLRSVARRAVKEWRVRGKRSHHLHKSTAQLVPVDHTPMLAEDVPDADVSIGTWWETREWVEQWPASKGIKAHFIRHFETFGGDPERVKAVYRLPGVKLVIARWLERLMRHDFAHEGVHLIPNGIDRTQFDAPPRGKAPRPTVGLVFGASLWKGSDVAFEALRRVERALPDLRVVAFGGSPLPSERHGLSGMEYHLRPPQEQIPQLYRGVDCWLMASVKEGFGMPGLEAAACRCPVVSTRSGGPEDYVVDGVSGYLVDVNDAPAMAEAILKVLRADEATWRAMSEASYRASLEFDWDRSAEKLERVLCRAVAHGGSTGAGNG